MKRGGHTATLKVSDAVRQEATREQRIVVIGEPVRPDWRFGVSAHLDWIPDFYAARAAAERAAQIIAELSVDVIRHDLGWVRIKPTRVAQRTQEWPADEPQLGRERKRPALPGGSVVRVPRARFELATP